MLGYLLTGLVALVITFTCTPAVRWLSTRIGAIDRPGDRKVHALPTPTLGGLAIALGITGALAAAYFLPEFRDKFTSSSEILGIVAGGIVVLFLGVVDDMRDLPAPVKLAGQVFAAGIIFLSGVQMKYILLPQGLLALSEDISVLLTIGWLVLMINAVNLVDGLDGLAAGIVSIAAAAFFVYSFRLESQGYLQASIASAPLIAIVIAGASLGFLRHNFYPARIFMGDSGAMLLGLMLGGATVAGVGTQGVPGSTSDAFLAYFPLLIPLAVIAIPLLDVSFAVVRRARRRRSVVTADKEHLHHRLMDLGHGHRQAVIVMYIWSALAAGAGLAFSFLDSSEVVFALPIAVGALVLYTLFPVLTKAIQERTRP